MTAEERKDYQQKGFTQSQIEVIEDGLADGVDVSVYAKKELMPQLMYQIRMGLQMGLDMSPYAIPDYDWFQLEEIRSGMQLGQDVSKYDSYKIPSKKMHEMRRGLERGIDLSDFLKYDAGVMREVRHSLNEHIDILNYVEAGYDGEQLYTIWTAIKNGVDIQQYLNSDFSAFSIQEIVIGLEQNLEVELYAKPCYSWSQMEQLRLGLQSQVDISYYQSPLYDRYQMEEIRLGLENNVEVSEYTSLQYPASYMRRIRLELQNGERERTSFKISDEELEEENRDGILITVSDDDMTAFIRFNQSKFGVTGRKEILRSLRVRGITQNIDPRMLDNLLSGVHLNETVPIARGQLPIDGEDGHYEFFFNTEKVRTIKVLPDGSVDFQNLEWYERVKRGQKLAYYHSAGRGEDGHTVTGKRIPPKRGKELPALRGKNFVVLDDHKTYISVAEGRVELDGFHMDVSTILNVRDVNQVTGNLDFDGNIIISGSVSNGVTIRSGGDVIIDGFVENSTIIAKGDVIMKKGVNGGGIGSITAEGSVEAKFFESVNVKAGKMIKVNYCLHSNIYSEGELTVFGNKGLILGGTAFAANDIKVANVGNALGVRTVIKMGVSETMKDEQRRIDSKAVDLSNKLAILYKGRRDFQDKYPTEVRNVMEVYLKIEDAIFTLEKEVEENKEEKEKLMKRIMMTADSMMTVTNDLFDNVLIEIDGRKIRSTVSKNVTVKKVDNRIGIFKNN